MTSPYQFATYLLAQSYRVLPTNLTSRTWGRFTRTGASRFLVYPYARLFGVAVDEAEKDWQEYSTLNAFFTRRLKPGSRPIDPDPQALVSPVDGLLSAAGTCDQDRLLQIKGITYDLFGLLRDAAMARHFEDGSYLTVYLSPRDYHRIHAPLDLTIQALGYVPGNLLPVNPPSVRHIPGLYTQNERVIIYADSPAGLMAMVLIGAHCVGSISLTFHDFVSNRPGIEPLHMNFKEKFHVNKGDELGAFEMGSTVVMLFARNRIKLDLPAQGEPGSKVRLGQCQGTTKEEK
jgi:phosphatidylserine decarboxylase